MFNHIIEFIYLVLTRTVGSFKPVIYQCMVALPLCLVKSSAGVNNGDDSCWYATDCSFRLWFYSHFVTTFLLYCRR